jgi:hypothetical protein
MIKACLHVRAGGPVNSRESIHGVTAGLLPRSLQFHRDEPAICPAPENIRGLILADAIPSFPWPADGLSTPVSPKPFSIGHLQLRAIVSLSDKIIPWASGGVSSKPANGLRGARVKPFVCRTLRSNQAECGL